MTNRLGRTIDRSRELLEMRVNTDGDIRKSHDAQLEILWQTALLIRTAITLTALAALVAATLLFVGVLLQLEMHRPEEMAP
jgi:hypothetical protein